MITNRLIPFPPFTAINLFGIIFVRRGKHLNAEDIRHERIHTRQMLELLIVGFYVLYVAEWLVRMVQKRGRAMQAYHAISFEREAFGCQHDTSYLSHRRHFAWLRYAF